MNSEQPTMGALSQCRSGIVALRKGQLLSAVREMRASLETLHSELGMESHPPSHPFPRMLPSVVSIPVNPELAQLSKNSSPDNEFDLCLTCFDLTFDECDDSDLVASVLLYNFAFGMHLYGLNTGTSRHLQRAMILYKKAKALIEHRRGDDRLSHISLALWTNLGHVSSHFLMQEDVHICRQRIRFLLSHGYGLKDSDLLFFSSMLISDLSNNCRNAAAA